MDTLPKRTEPESIGEADETESESGTVMTPHQHIGGVGKYEQNHNMHRNPQTNCAFGVIVTP